VGGGFLKRKGAQEKWLSGGGSPEANEQPQKKKQKGRRKKNYIRLGGRLAREENALIQER